MHVNISCQITVWLVAGDWDCVTASAGKQYLSRLHSCLASNSHRIRAVVPCVWLQYYLCRLSLVSEDTLSFWSTFHSLAEIKANIIFAWKQSISVFPIRESRHEFIGLFVTVLPMSGVGINTDITSFPL